MESLTVLSERYAVPVLVYLLKNEYKVKFSDLKPIVNNYPTLEKLMNTLEDSGLVILSRVLKPYKTNFAELTDLGHRVASKLATALDILTGDTPEPITNHSNAPSGGRSVNS